MGDNEGVRIDGWMVSLWMRINKRVKNGWMNDNETNWE